MTTQQLFMFNCMYAILLAIVAVLTRDAPAHCGALAGGACAGVVGLVLVGHGMMRLVPVPAKADRLANRTGKSG